MSILKSYAIFEITLTLVASGIALVAMQTKAPIADEPQCVGYSYNFNYTLSEVAPEKIVVKPILPLSKIIASLDCGCQSGRSCKCHNRQPNGQLGHCNCAAKIRQAKAKYTGKRRVR